MYVCTLYICILKTVLTVKGFPLSTLAGNRGQPGDPILDIRSPALFVVGEKSSSCQSDDMEDIRERLGVETGLVIVGGVEGDPVLSDSTLETTADGVHFSALANVPIRIDAYKMSTKLSYLFSPLSQV